MEMTDCLYLYYSTGVSMNGHGGVGERKGREGIVFSLLAGDTCTWNECMSSMTMAA